MTTQILTLELPEDFVRDAADFGLFSQTEIFAVLRNELDRRIAALIESEIQAYRAENRASYHTIPILTVNEFLALLESPNETTP